MAIGDVYQVRVLQTFHGEACANVFYYQAVTGTGHTAEDVFAEFADVVWDAVRGVQSARVNTNRFEIINGMNNLDFYYYDTDSDGVYDGGLDIPPQGAYAFRSPSGGPGSRYSYKRFVGCMTGALASTGFPIWNTGFREGAMSTAAIALGTVLEGAMGTYTPAQVTGGFKLGEEPEVAQFLEGNWSFNSWMSTQRTRAAYAWVGATEE